MAAKKKAPTKKTTKKVSKKSSPSGEVKTGKSLSAKEKAAAFIKEMNSSKKYKGKAQFCFANEHSTPYHLRRPTGVMGLDIALGGGLHAGGGVQVYGGRSAGKTHLALRSAGEVQRNYGEEAIIAIGITEIRLDKAFCRKSGFCVAYSDREIKEFEGIRKLQGLPPFTAEERKDLKKQIGTVLIYKAETGDKMLDQTIEGLRALHSSCQLLIIESLGALLAPDQNEKDVGDRVYGGSSGMVTTWQNKIYPLFMLDGEDGSMLETTILGINQARAVIGGSPRGPKERPAAGAYSWQHAQLADIELRSGKTFWADSAHTIRGGRRVHWEIKKGKAGTHDGLSGEYDWHMMPKTSPVFWSEYELMGSQWGIDTITDLVETGIKVGAINRGGSWLDFGSIHVNGVEAFTSIVVADPEVEQALKDACLRAANLTVRYK
jgi:RecA/RadA recombinase